MKQIKILSIFISLLSMTTLYVYLLRSSKKNEVFDTPGRISKLSTTYTKSSDAKTYLYFKEDRIVHLDLKGAPPKISYFRKIFPLLAELGATGLLIEYEDMFPYSDILANISALNAYSTDDIDVINKLAKENNLKIIPLVQIFGHLEYILKQAEFKEYREVTAYPQIICPTHNNTVSLLVTVIKQIVRAHPHLEMIHIGTDDVQYLGQCTRCNQFIQRRQISKNILFLNHVKNVTDAVQKIFPKLRVLMWDNQIRSISLGELEKMDLSPKIEPVVWKHTNDIYEDLGPTLWYTYGRIFKHVWSASAFKGTMDGFMPNFSTYLLNQKGWLSILKEYKDTVSFRGIILVGQQRYDHFSVLSELFPVSIPSLALSLRLLSGHVDPPLNPPSHVARILQCKQPYALMSLAFGSPKCSYPGGDVLEYVIQLHQLIQEYDALVEDKRYARWMNEYNVKYSFSNPSHIESLTLSLSKIKNELATLEVDITLALSEIYDIYTIEEWKSTYMQPYQEKVQSMWEARNRILMKDSWPRRPLQQEL